MENNVKKPRLLYASMITLSALIAVAGEADMDWVGIMATWQQANFALATAMELLAVAGIPLCLKLRSRLRPVIACWLFAPLGAMLVADTLLYYMTLSVAFGYLALIMLLALFFAWPASDDILTEGKEGAE